MGQQKIILHFDYLAPQIDSIGPAIPLMGGSLTVKGLNFGVDAQKISVTIGKAKVAVQAKIDISHIQLLLRIPPAADLLQPESKQGHQHYGKVPLEVIVDDQHADSVFSYESNKTQQEQELEQGRQQHIFPAGAGGGAGGGAGAGDSHSIGARSSSMRYSTDCAPSTTGASLTNPHTYDPSRRPQSFSAATHSSRHAIGAIGSVDERRPHSFNPGNFSAALGLRAGEGSDRWKNGLDTVRRGQDGGRSNGNASMLAAFFGGIGIKEDFNRTKKGTSNASPRQFQQPDWVPDEEVNSCQICSERFTFIVRKHHCRLCGFIICTHCSAKRKPIERRQNGELLVDWPW